MLSFRIFGFFCLYISLIFFDVNNPLPKLHMFLLFFILGIHLFFTTHGVRIDPNLRRVKQYVRFALFRLGSWQKYTETNDILCIRSKEKHNVYDETRGHDRSVSLSVKYEIYLADRNHFNLTLLRSFSSDAEAEYEADILADQMGLPWVQYNPGRRMPRKVLGGRTPA